MKYNRHNPILGINALFNAVRNPALVNPGH